MSNLKPGDKAIAFELPGTDGQTYRLKDYGEYKAVAVIFTCNHCPYVLAWEDRIIQAQADYADQGVRFLAICANDSEKYPTDSFPAMKQHAIEKGFNFPYLHDETQEIARAYGAERTPEIFLFDGDGVLRYHGAPDDNYDDPGAARHQYLRNAIEAVLAGHTPSPDSTKPIGCTVKWKPEQPQRA